ncbi:MAG: 2-C-methyl-D-erythritol 4-phosphate cytidylyltransferase [Ignavibacteria bacterium RBG_16_34_14]|nr:MAG: 2-C-methyl-D-erythritol 4-phosphate cytidylyltransferase [Ignavibacteria bacterium RBG_16_34_14]
MRTYVIIPAGGKGKRSGVKIPKQYLKINGKELIIYTLKVFQKNKLVDEIVIPAEPQYHKKLKNLVKKYNLSKVTLIIEGGKERQDSVYNALCSLPSPSSNDLIAVHDAARPLLPQKVLTSALIIAKKKGNAVVCIKAKDTLIKGKEKIEEYLNRDEVYYVQTPQVFRYKDLKKAMNTAHKDNFYGTDESMLVNRIGIKVNIVEGSVFNFKVTSKDDVEMFKSMLKRGAP